MVRDGVDLYRFKYILTLRNRHFGGIGAECFLLNLDEQQTQNFNFVKFSH